MQTAHTLLLPPSPHSVDLDRETRWLRACERLADVGVLEWTPGSDQIGASEQARRLLGLPLAGPLDLARCLACFDATGQTVLQAALLTEYRQPRGWRLELALPAPPGERARVLSIAGASEVGPRVLVVLQDVSAQAAARGELEEALQRLDLATHAAGIGSWQWALAANRIECDEQMQALLGLGPAPTPLQCLARIHAEDRPRFEQALRAALRGPADLDVCHRVERAASGERHLRSVARVLRGEGGRVERLVGVSWDETALRVEARELRHRADHDGLTGLVNRTEFLRRLQRALRQSGPHALLALDLDRFKQVNDRLGHAAGDAVLRRVAVLLGRGVRQRDTVARLGGDEFMLLLEHCDAAQARSVAEQVRQSLAQAGMRHAGELLDIGVSIGCTMLTPGESAAAAMARADAACLAAKAAGRNQVQTG